MGPRNRVFLRKDGFEPVDSVKNPVSLSECVQDCNSLWTPVKLTPRAPFSTIPEKPRFLTKNLGFYASMRQETKVMRLVFGAPI